MVAGKESFLPQSITYMICHMAGRGDGFKRPVFTIDNVPIGQNMVGFEGVIGIFFKARSVKVSGFGGGQP